MIICVDLDGVIAEDDNNYPNYEDCRVMKGAVEYLASLRDAGHRIIIYTSRGWWFFEITLDWLNRKGVPFDTLVMDKPYGDVYIDDRAMKFESWGKTWKQLEQISTV